MIKKEITQGLPKPLLNLAIFTSRLFRSFEFLFSKVGFWKYNFYNFRELVLGDRDFIVRYGNLKFHSFGREILCERNDLTYSKLRGCDNVLDLGGYNGDTALFLSEFENKKIYVFEPEKKKFEFIKKNIALNQKGKVVFPYNYAAVASELMEMEIFHGSSYDVASSAYSSEGKSEIVKCMHISDILKLADFDGLKCDIEGGEWEIIEWLIENNRLLDFKKVIFELHFSKRRENWDLGFKELIGYLKKREASYSFMKCEGGERIRDIKDTIDMVLGKKYNGDNFSLMLYFEGT